MSASLSHLPIETPREQARAADAHPEWLETDGCGGFACGLLSLARERRYHGLLVAVPPGTARRHLFLAELSERVTRGGTELELPSTRDMTFRARPWPTFAHDRETFAFQREILMVRHQPTTLVRYSVRQRGAKDETPWTLTLRPVLACREADALTVRNAVLRPHVETVPGGIRCRPYDALPAVTLTVSAGREPDWVFEPDPRWFTDVGYAIDSERGYDGREDLFSPGRFVVRVGPKQAVTVAATIGNAVTNPGGLWRTEAKQRKEALPQAPTLKQRLARAGEDFLYRDADGRAGVLAGFPWFGEWGRDTYIALPGLTLARGDLDACADVLSTATHLLADGLLPNVRGSARADSHYGSADASLWYARAVQLYDRAGGSEDRLLGEYLPALREIATTYAAGEEPAIRALGIYADEAGMLCAGTPALNPTWMDAKIASGPVTPRHGCAVELGALWYALLAYLAELCERAGAGEEAARWRGAAERAGEAFRARFVQPGGALADVWHPDGIDASVRPNMVLAAALELSPLDRDQRAGVLRVAERALLTPFGLRTLAPGDPAYAARYEGGSEQRDGAYHQGTVWPWLLGFYCEAALRVDASEGNRRALRGLWDALAGELDVGCREHLAEVYDASVPQRGGGSFAQAWNTAEMQRALALLDGSLPLSGGARA